MNKLPNGQIELSLIYKGLLIARRDWCPLSVQIGKDILHIILSDASIQTKNNSIHELFKNISKMIRENNIPVSSFLISKNLSRNLNNYQDNNQLHIQVARRLNERSGRIWKVGDTVSYVICKDESNVQKSYDINEFKEDKSLKIDINYYLTKQFLPVLSTICEPIMKIDKKLIENLVKEEIETETSKNIEGKTVTQGELNHCKAFTFKCRNCKTDITITNILSNSSNDCQLFLQTTCSNDKCKTPLWKNARTIADELQLSIKKAIDMYDLSGFKCENPKCNYETKWPPLDSSTKLECKICKKSYLSRKYTKLNLQDQINFYRDIFDLSKLQNESLVNTCSQEVISTYNMLKDNVNKYVEIYSNSIVSLDQLFRYKFKKHSENNIDFNISFNDYIHAEDDK
ncbi:PREDICTED: DNA polymerase alpha catalytic subunit-like [Polistes dominula]|uniref:DNA-directed DNA polymerase n=1 Tax=Polistes dominula TaxID=743375 RepID=A0ABM1I7P1_POLDO|nr:PREDICTED: DNA polymerase alpha catalytic subunit-like [Polistes dominula]